MSNRVKLDASAAQILLQVQGALYADYSEASDALKLFPTLSNGLTPDSVKELPEYQSARTKSKSAFDALCKFNRQYARQLQQHARQANRK